MVTLDVDIDKLFSVGSVKFVLNGKRSVYVQW